MSYSIIYDKQFIKAEHKGSTYYVPMVLTGSSNVYDHNGARTRSWFSTYVFGEIFDTEENLIKTAKFAAELGDNLLRIELLPYHKFGTGTYEQLGRKYELEGIEPPSEEYMIKLKKLIESCGIKVQIGG